MPDFFHRRFRLPRWFNDIPFRTIWGLVWPQMLMLLGVLDQWKDLRRLSKNNETEEDRV